MSGKILLKKLLLKLSRFKMKKLSKKFNKLMKRGLLHKVINKHLSREREDKIIEELSQSVSEPFGIENAKTK